MIAGLKERTGRSLDEWRQVLRASGLAKHKELVTLLKTQHGVDTRLREHDRAASPRHGQPYRDRRTSTRRWPVFRREGERAADP
ncbi:MAG: DUF4287 domain-containing protein [Acidobacteriota bacterium]